MSKHSVPAGDIYALLARFSEFKQRAFARTGKSFPIIVIQEAGLDGFWIHRELPKTSCAQLILAAGVVITSQEMRRRSRPSRGRSIKRCGPRLTGCR